MKIKTVLWGLATAALLVSCSGAKLSVANEQYARGEFYDAAQTYRKVYSKTNPRKERKLRGEIAFKMAECYRRINMAPRRLCRLPECNSIRLPRQHGSVLFSPQPTVRREIQRSYQELPSLFGNKSAKQSRQKWNTGLQLSPAMEENAYTVCRKKSDHVQLSTERFRTDVFRRRFRSGLFLLVYRKGIGQE